MLAVMAVARLIDTEGHVAEHQDMRAASETYSGFLTLLKWGTLLSAAMAALVVFIIA
jgi:hypothetical protein